MVTVVVGVANDGEGGGRRGRSGQRRGLAEEPSGEA